MRFLLLFILCATTAANADEIARPCADESGPHFRFQYRHRPGTPLVIYFPGGPGLGAMERKGWPVPKDFGVIFFDPRGVGVNAGRECGEMLRLTSEELADDAIAIIDKVKPRKLILFGASYGTVVGTVVAKRLEERHFKGEVTLLLEGVFGRALRPGEYSSEFVKQWNALMAELPRESQKTLREPRPLDFAPEVWGGWIEEQLGMAAPTMKAMLTDIGSAATAESLREFAMREPLSVQHRIVFKAIGCHELVTSAAASDNNFVLDRGMLSEASGNLCAGIPLDRPFDSAKWPLTRTKIIYFIGERDPVTFAALSAHHIEANAGAPKQVLRVEQGGHAPLQFTLNEVAEQLIREIGTIGKVNSSLPAVMSPP